MAKLQPMGMIRTTVWLTARQAEGLARIGKEDGLRAAAVLRIFVNEGLKRHSRQDQQL